MPLVLASATTAILIATGVGLVAIIVGGVGIYATLGGDDREGMRGLLRHPLRSIFTEDEPDDPDATDAGPDPRGGR